MGMLKDILDILMELRALREQLRPLTDYFATLQTVAQEQSAPTSTLPQDFPGRDELEAARITAVADIPRTIKQIEALPGIDSAVAMQIAMRLMKK